MQTKQPRRSILKGIIALAVLGMMPFKLLARSVLAFEAEQTAEVYRTLFGDLPVEETSDIRLKVPDIAENGAVVPVSVSTALPGVVGIYVIIDKNPNPLSAAFEIGPTTLADISVRVKMGKSSRVQALVKTRDKVYMTSKEVKVTIGGCGG